jgi:hypothetical protein
MEGKAGLRIAYSNQKSKYFAQSLKLVLTSLVLLNSIQTKLDFKLILG